MYETSDILTKCWFGTKMSSRRIKSHCTLALCRTKCKIHWSNTDRTIDMQQKISHSINRICMYVYCQEIEVKNAIVFITACFHSEMMCITADNLILNRKSC